VRARKLIGVATATALLASCGGDDASDPEFVARADAICTDALRQINRLPQPQGNRELPELIRQSRPIVREELKRLRELEAPADEASRFDALLAALSERAAALDDVAAAAGRRDAEAAQAGIDRSAEASDRSDEIARDLGLEVCGREERE